MKYYLIIHKLKITKQGVLIIVPASNKDIECTVIAFVDNTSFYTNGQNYQNKIQIIVEEYTRLHKVIGEKVKQIKSFCYA